MKRPVLTLSLLLLAAGAAQAQPIGERPPTRTIQCVDVSGRLLPAVCKTPGSRVDPTELHCICPGEGLRTEVPICAPGEKPTPDSAAANRARRLAARDGTLVGDTFEGQRICAAPRRP